MVSLTYPSELLESRYKDKLESRYEEPIHQVVTKIFRGLSGKKVIMPSKDFVRSVLSFAPFFTHRFRKLLTFPQPPWSQRSQVLDQGQ